MTDSSKYAKKKKKKKRKKKEMIKKFEAIIEWQSSTLFLNSLKFYWTTRIHNMLLLTLVFVPEKKSLYFQILQILKLCFSINSNYFSLLPFGAWFFVNKLLSNFSPPDTHDTTVAFKISINLKTWFYSYD